MERSTPRITSVMGVARALLATVTVEESVEVLIAEFGWDLTFQALALLRGDGADQAFGFAWEYLLTHPVTDDIREVEWRLGMAWPEE